MYIVHPLMDYIFCNTKLKVLLWINHKRNIFLWTGPDFYKILWAESWGSLRCILKVGAFLFSIWVNFSFFLSILNILDGPFCAKY